MARLYISEDLAPPGTTPGAHLKNTHHKEVETIDYLQEDKKVHNTRTLTQYTFVLYRKFEKILSQGSCFRFPVCLLCKHA